MISSIDDLEIGNAKLIAGVDEVGRGPLAGPVIASAVILDPKKKIDNLCDSKKLSSKMRFLISKNIKMNCIEWSVGRAEVNEIDELDFGQFSKCIEFSCSCATSCVGASINTRGAENNGTTIYDQY